MKHPWDTGPTELIAFALETMHGGGDFDRRLSFLILDVGVETLLKTFLSLPERVSGAKSAYGKRRAAIGGSFNDLVNGIQEAVPDRSESLNLDYVMYYHGIRNTLYHQGTTVGTVRQDQLEGYADLAVHNLNALLNVDLSPLLEAPPPPPLDSTEADQLAEETTLDAVRDLLTRIRIPNGQLAIYKALYDAGEKGLTSSQLEKKTGRPGSVLAGALGALGNRIANTPGFEHEANINAVLDITAASDSGWRYRMRPLLKEALEVEGVFEKYKDVIQTITGAPKRKISPRNKLYMEFFDELSELYWREVLLRRRPIPQPQNWYWFGAGKSGFSFGWEFRNRGRFSAEVYIDTLVDAAANLNYLNQLKKQVKLPDSLSDLRWEDLPSARACRIVVYRSGEIESLSSDPKKRAEVIAWGIETLRAIEQTFREPISSL